MRIHIETDKRDIYLDSWTLRWWVRRRTRWLRRVRREEADRVVDYKTPNSISDLYKLTPSDVPFLGTFNALEPNAKTTWEVDDDA